MQRYTTDDLEYYEGYDEEDEAMYAEPSYEVEHPSEQTGCVTFVDAKGTYASNEGEECEEGEEGDVEKEKEEEGETEEGCEEGVGARQSSGTVADYLALREALAKKNLVVDALSDRAVLSLHERLCRNEGVFSTECDSIKGSYPACKIDLDSRWLRLPIYAENRKRGEPEMYRIEVNVPIDYPQEPPAVSTGNEEYKRMIFFLGKMLRRGKQNLLSQICAFLFHREDPSQFLPAVPALACSEDDELRCRWMEATGEDIPEQRSANLFVATAPSSRVTIQIPTSTSGGSKSSLRRLRLPRAARRRGSGNAAVEDENVGASSFGGGSNPGASPVLLQRMADVRCHQLTSLYGHGCGSVVPPSINTLTSLQVLDLTGSAVSTLPHFGSLALKKLFLANNEFSEFPTGILTASMASSLRFFDISFNQLKTIPAEFSRFTSIEVLELGHNQLTTLCDLSGMVNSLEVLDVTDNNLPGLPPVIGQCPKLWRLKTTANPMFQIPPEVFWTQGIEAAKEYLREFSPHTLTVPPSTFVNDMVRMWEGEDSAKEVELCAWIDESFSMQQQPEHKTGDELVSIVSSADGAHRLSTRVHLVSLLARAPTLAAIALSIPKYERVVVCLDGPNNNGDADNNERIGFSCATSLEAFARFLTTGEIEVARPCVAEFLRIGAVCDIAPQVLGELQRIAEGVLYDANESVAACYEQLITVDLAGVVASAKSPERGAHEEHQTVPAANADEFSSAPATGACINNCRQFGDVSFVVGEQRVVFRGHRPLLCARSSYIQAMLSFQSPPSTASSTGGTGSFTEGYICSKDIPDADPDVFAAFFHFLYSDTHGKKMTTENAVNLLFLTEHFQCSRLQGMAEAMVGHHVDDDNAAQILQIAYFLDLARLKKSCMYFVATNVSAVRQSEGWDSLEDSAKRELVAKMVGWGMTPPAALEPFLPSSSPSATGDSSSHTA